MKDAELASTVAFGAAVTDAAPDERAEEGTVLLTTPLLSAALLAAALLSAALLSAALLSAALLAGALLGAEKGAEIGDG